MKSLKILQEQIAVVRALLVENRLEFLMKKYGEKFDLVWQEQYIKATEQQILFEWARSKGWEVHDEQGGEGSPYVIVNNRITNKNGAYLFKPKIIFDLVCYYDPTRNKIYSQWLLTQTLNGNLRLEDLQRVSEELKTFDRVKGKMPEQARDILRYKNAEDLYVATQPYVNIVSQNELDKQYEQKMYSEAVVQYNSPNFKIVTPKTKEAAIYFGRNTRWCTAATDSQNMFSSYNSKGPLYIILDKKNNKRWQYHPNSNEFRDEVDRSVRMSEFNEQYPEVAEYFIQEALDTYTFYEANKNYYVGYVQEQHRIIVRARTLSANVVTTFDIGENNELVHDSYIKNLSNGMSSLLKEIFNKVGVKGPNYEYLADINVCFDEKTNKWTSLSEATIPLTSIGMFEKWAYLDITNPVGLQFKYFYHFQENGKHDWKVRLAGKELEIFADQWSKTSEDRKRDNWVNKNDKSINAGNHLQTNNIQKFNARHANDFAELLLNLPNDIKIESDELGVLSYDPFEIMDEELLKRVDDHNPNVLNLRGLTRIHGLDNDKVKNKIYETVEDVLDRVSGIPRWNDHGLAITETHGLGSFAGFTGNKEFDNFVETISDEDDDFTDHNFELRNMLDILKSEELKQVGEYLRETYPDEVIDEFGDDPDDFETDDVDHLVTLMNNVHDETIMDACRDANQYGYEAGISEQKQDVLKKALQEIKYLYIMGDDNILTSDFSKVYLLDEGIKFFYIVPTKILVDKISKDSEFITVIEHDGWMVFLDDEVKLHQPSYGYDDFDQETARETLIDQLTSADILARVDKSIGNQP